MSQRVYMNHTYIVSKCRFIMYRYVIMWIGSKEMATTQKLLESFIAMDMVSVFQTKNIDSFCASPLKYVLCALIRSSQRPIK